MGCRGDYNLYNGARASVRAVAKSFAARIMQRKQLNTITWGDFGASDRKDVYKGCYKACPWLFHFCGEVNDDCWVAWLIVQQYLLQAKGYEPKRIRPREQDDDLHRNASKIAPKDEIAPKENDLYYLNIPEGGYVYGPKQPIHSRRQQVGSPSSPVSSHHARRADKVVAGEEGCVAVSRPKKPTTSHSPAKSPHTIVEVVIRSPAKPKGVSMTLHANSDTEMEELQQPKHKADKKLDKPTNKRQQLELAETDDEGERPKARKCQQILSSPTPEPQPKVQGNGRMHPKECPKRDPTPVPTPERTPTPEHAPTPAPVPIPNPKPKIQEKKRLRPKEQPKRIPTPEPELEPQAAPKPEPEPKPEPKVQGKRGRPRTKAAPKRDPTPSPEPKLREVAENMKRFSGTLSTESFELREVEGDLLAESAPAPDSPPNPTSMQTKRGQPKTAPNEES
ncbi:hypothetical protein CTheo_7121 [Ceratobasidium theobromae]|uniref:Uncharacterized protein n=1 Tax=Ceratobasidium theobromae TaxID=1582974 RepID=A0A5N5QCH6_9AGAM|nr:hypothetical protein CTheo_7121 [Ceratobasidium theobromae]